MSLDGVYDSKANRKMIFNHGMTPNIPEKNEIEKLQSAAEKESTALRYLKNDFILSSGSLHGRINSSYYC